VTTEELAQLNAELEVALAQYLATTTSEERAEDDYWLQRGYDEAKGELA
jgi:hypothetical protein